MTTIRGRQPTSTRAKVHVPGGQPPTKPLKAPVPKASERISKSTSTRAGTVPLSSTEAKPAPAAPKEPTDAPTESTVKTESTDPPKEPRNLSESTTNSKPSAADKPIPTSDSLQVAAQLYPWIYMTSTLDACFESAEQSAKAHLETRAQHLTESESLLADQKTRFQAERAADFYDVLSTDVFARTAPRIMQAFLAHGDACEHVEAEALQLALDPAKTSTLALTAGDEDEGEDGDWDAPLRVYAKMLDTLDQLHAEALDLETSIVKLTASLEPYSHTEPENNSADAGGTIHDTPAEPTPNTESGAQAQILGVFKACLPVLRARIANLVMAQELIDGARENMSICVRMESLGLLE
ncbi:hypothetical protein C0995_009144 [Termitomyces sp. Mi166|nr:hypothetical protein C0995_009144 [Termitomyces sp. Mi166\